MRVGTEAEDDRALGVQRAIFSGQRVSQVMSTPERLKHAGDAASVVVPILSLLSKAKDALALPGESWSFLSLRTKVGHFQCFGRGVNSLLSLFSHRK